jgi:NAD(P)-dependent dehydrogenase (short-subunit alcohol dehydrogenase family)
VAETVARFGRLDVAINNASKEVSGPTLDLPSEDFTTVIDTNLKGTYYGMKHQVAQMRKNGGGAIVNQASVTSSITGVPDNGLYAATKGGIIGLTKFAALQVASENISINAIASCAFDIPDDMFLRWIDDHHVTREQAVEWFPSSVSVSPRSCGGHALSRFRRSALRGRPGADHRRRIHCPIGEGQVSSRRPKASIVCRVWRIISRSCISEAKNQPMAWPSPRTRSLPS